MLITIIVAVVCFTIGVAVGIIYTNWAISDAIGRRMGW